ncbi:OmpH family outer membrane protein [Mycobacterium koreense]|nr:OmpH family outer membrane protein [Mycolicibacillus koreensis]MCV7247688.1 OmpH family outer membrane protein [Mycolicibacillus koreensis]
MTAPDMPPVVTPHSHEIMGEDGWPKFSETGNVQLTLQQFEAAAASVGTENVSMTMFALIEANATGQTPERLLEDFTEDQRKAFDHALAQLNQGQCASVAAQDILNTKVQINGVVMDLEAAVEQLIAEYGATGPMSPRSQQEFQQRYQDLMDQAKSKVASLMANHRDTQDALAANIQKGSTPEVPATMNPGDGAAQVPGMPPDALGALVQPIAGIMSKPPNLPMPKLDQAAQPAIQAAQQGLGELMKSAGKGGGVAVSKDALSKLVSNTANANQKATLSAPSPAQERTAETAASGPGSTRGLRSPLSSSAPDNQRHDPVVSADTEEPTEEVTATTPTGPADTDGPDSSQPAVTLSSGGTDDGPSALSEPGARTHLSAGEATSGASTLSHSPSSSAAQSPAAAGAGMGGGMPMMAPMMGGAAGAARAADGSSGSKTAAGSSSAHPPRAYDPRDPHKASSELTDFGSDLKGLDHATDKQLIAASVLAGLVRAHRRAGVITEIAVGVNDTGAVFVTSDGLGFLPPKVRVASHVRPLVMSVPDAFIAHWLGCGQPWRPLLEAVGQRYVDGFDAIVTTDPTAESRGVLALDSQQIDAVNISAGTEDRGQVDAVDAADVDDVVAYLDAMWGPADAAADELFERVEAARWDDGGDSDVQRYRQAWADYLIAAARADIDAANHDDARYVLRCALRVPTL